MRIVIGHDDAVANWVGFKLKQPMIPPYTALGWIDDTGKLCVGFVFFAYIPNGNVDIAVAATGRMSRSILRAVGDYVFRQSQCSRITARTRVSNERAQSILTRAGFVKESVCKAYYGDDDAVQFRLTRKEANRWIA